MRTFESPCPRRRRRVSLALAASLLLSGCASLQEALAPEAPRPAPVPTPAQSTVRARPTGMLRLEEYLVYARQLSAAQPAQQKKVYQQAIAAYQQSPTPHRKLRYALTLDVLASPYSDPRKALQLFKELAAAEPALPRELRLWVETQVHGLQRRLELSDRVAILTKALHDADAKIDALADIEQKLESPAEQQEANQNE